MNNLSDIIFSQFQLALHSPDRRIKQRAVSELIALALIQKKGGNWLWGEMSPDD